jgi:hypothetical protein
MHGRDVRKPERKTQVEECGCRCKDNNEMGYLDQDVDE